MIPDLYDISTSCEITAEEYGKANVSNDPQNENYVISGSLLKYTVGSSWLTIELQTSISAKQSIVISKFTMQEQRQQ